MTPPRKWVRHFQALAALALVIALGMTALALTLHGFLVWVEVAAALYCYGVCGVSLKHARWWKGQL